MSHRILAALILATLAGAAAFGQPNTGARGHPDYLTLGTVRLGAIVECSVRAYEGGPPGDAKPTITAPPFVTVDRSHGDSWNVAGRIEGFCDVEFTIDTRTAGDHSGSIDVSFGPGPAIKVPLRVKVKAPEAGLTRVLIASTPFRSDATHDGRHFKPLTELVDAALLAPSYLNVDRGKPVLRDLDLAKFDVVLLGDTGLACLTDADRRRVRQFVDGGGRLVVAGNAFYVGTVAGANSLIQPYGLKMTDAEPAAGRGLPVPRPKADPLTKDIGPLRFYRPSPVRVLDNKKGKLLVAAPPYPGEGFAAVARAGDGEVVALGQSLWWAWIGPDWSQQADNAKFVQRLLTRPGQGDPEGAVP